jgi:hypothetical protein
MAKPKPRTFTKTIDGREYVQVAYTPGDAVALTFNGWREQLDTAPTTATATKAAATTSASDSTPKKAAPKTTK